MSTNARRPATTKTPKSAGKLVLEFPEFDRETKNAIRFQEYLPKGKERGDIGFVYVLKSALERADINPDNGIRVTVEELPE